jgi:hypothetical protein
LQRFIQEFLGNLPRKLELSGATGQTGGARPV